MAERSAFIWTGGIIHLERRVGPYAGKYRAVRLYVHIDLEVGFIMTDLCRVELQQKCCFRGRPHVPSAILIVVTREK